MDLLNDLISQVSSASPELLTILAVVVVGYACKLSTWVRNQFIPAIGLLVATTTYPLLCPPSAINPEVRYPLVREILTGTVLWFIAWFAHDKVLRKLERFLPDELFPKPPETPK